MTSKPKRGALSAFAASWIREQILAKNLEAGSVVRPEYVGDELGISQTPAREALQTLRTEGFLKVVPGTGFVVDELTPKDVEDIFVAHAFIAGEIARRAAITATQREIRELEAINYELLAAYARGDESQVEQKNHEFHRLISKMANAPKLSRILSIVSHYIPRSFYSSVKGWGEASAGDHEAILKAFRSGDGDGAAQAMASHLRHAGKLLAQNYEID